MAGNSHSFYGDLRDENVIYRLGGFNGNAAKGLVYKHSHIISAQIGIKTAQKAMEKGFDQLLTKAKAELNSQIK